MSLYLIAGKTCSGKDSIVRKLQELGYKRLLSSTTRPMRVGETNGVDYYFKDTVDYDNAYCLKSFTVANNEVWRYWLDKDDVMDAVNSDKSYICIVDADGEKELRKYATESFYISVDWTTRLQRYFHRESKNSNPNYKEMVRRMIADEKDFDSLELDARTTSDVVLISNVDLNLSVSKIDRIIRNSKLWCGGECYDEFTRTYDS